MTSEEYAAAYVLGFDRTAGFLMRHGARRIEDAKDFAQDAWFRGWQHVDEIRNDIAILGYVNKIALNLWRSHWRNHDVERDALLPKWGTDILARRGMPTAHIDTWDMDRRKLMRMAPERDRELMRDYYVDGYTGPELAERWGACHNTIKVRIMRASERLAAEVCGKRR